MGEPEAEPSEADKVYQWRLEELLAGGYDEVEALLIAADETIDLHKALELRGEGCPSRLAFWILA